MLKSVAAVSCASFFGFELISIPLERHFDTVFRAGLGSCVGIIFSAWIFFIFSIKIPLTLVHGVIHSIILLAMAVFIRLFRILRKKKLYHKLFSPLTYLFSVVIPFSIIAFFISTGLLKNGRITKGAAYGDFPFHMNIISSFVYGCNKNRKSLYDLKTPFYSNEKLAYPIIPDFYSSVLISCFGATINDSAVIPSYVFIAGLFIVLSNITYQFSNSEIACCLAPYLFIFSGGIGFTRWFDPNLRKFHMIDYVHNWGDGRYEYWFNPIIHILLPQRLSLFSLPIAWGVIAVLMKCNFSLNISSFIFAGFLVALLPQVQTHSIIALFEWGVSFALITFPFSKPNKWKPYILNYISLGIVAILLGFPQCINFFDRAKNHFFSIKPLYLEMTDRNYLTMWWYGLGAFIVIALIHGPIILNKKQFLFYTPSLFVFLISNIIWYQPWSFDNTKVFNAAFMPLASACIANFLVRIGKFGFISSVISSLLFVFCTISGMLGAYNIGKNSYNLWKNADESYNIAKFVCEKTEPDAIWITDSDHTNPIVTLAGRQVFVGYQGWLLSHNLDYSERMRIINRLSWDPDSVEYYDPYNISYIGVRTDYRGVYFYPNEDLGYWKLIFQTDYFKAYKRTKKNK